MPDVPSSAGRRAGIAVAVAVALSCVFPSAGLATGAANTVRIHGAVHDPSGKGVANFPLRVRDQDGHSFEIRTGPKGTFSAVGLTPGAIVVTLEGATYQQSRSTCHVDAGLSANVSFAAIPGRGYVTEPCRVEPPTTDVDYINK